MANITPFSFQDSPVRTVIIADAVHFVGKDICEILGYADSSSAMKQHCRAPVKHHPILDALGRAQETRVLAESDALSSHCKGVAKTYPLQTSGGIQNVRILSEPDVLRLIVRSTLPDAIKFEAWVFEEVLPAIRKTGSYTAPGKPESAYHGPMSPRIEEAAIYMMVAESMVRTLNLTGSARLEYMGRIAERLAPAIADAMPAYAVNAPTGAILGIGSEPAFSISALAKEHGVKQSARALNKLLAAGGYIKELTRASSKGGVKAFWSVTEKGSAFGMNLTNKANQAETQPVWFSSRFPDLLAELA